MDKDYPLDRLMVYVNDVPVPMERGVDLRRYSKKDWKQKVPVDLTKGDNLVKVSTFNRQGLESLRESFNIVYEPEKEIKPKLYMMSIGVSEFGEESRNLKFPIKDATDLAKKFKKSNCYQDVVTRIFHNEVATKEKIQQEAKSFLEQATIHDQIVVYISSHGLLDDSLEYYIAMHDIDFNNPSAKGLSYSHINQTLDGLACRSRLVLIDTCHSGEVDKEDVSSIQKFLPSSSHVKANAKSENTLIRPKLGLKNSFNYMKALFNDFSKGTGATVISAAGGFEFTLESDEWNNGVFTYAIIQGFSKDKKSGYLQADFNQDSQVTVSELKYYVTLQVTELTNGKQHPTTRNENSINDPVLFITK